LAEFTPTEGDYESQSHHLIHSPWQRYWAGLPRENRGVLDLFDLETGAGKRIAIEASPRERERKIIVSPRDDIVAIYPYEKNVHKAGWDSWFETLKLEVHLHALPGGERLGSFLILADNKPKPKKHREREFITKFDYAQFSPDGSYFVYPSTHKDEFCLRLW